MADNEALAEIWQGDRLNRREEALSIQAFLEEEVREMARQGRGHSYVLAIDAAYGVGKTFFLERFLKQLRLSHPVAHFDAWVDDANEEPLVAIMAAIEDALKPYMAAGTTVRQKFRAATDLYFERFDGTAATCEDFVRCMEEAGGVDLTQFRR